MVPFPGDSLINQQGWRFLWILDTKSHYGSCSHILLYFIFCFLSILAQLKHPHVVSFQESFFDPSEETLFIVQVLVIWYTSYEMVMLVAIIIGWVEFDVKNYTD